MTNSVFNSYPSNIIHDIYVSNSSGDFFNIILTEMANGICKVDVISRRHKEGDSLFNNLKDQISYDDAFSTAIDFIKNHFKGEITSIDNPCNTPFISKSDQESILKNKNINISVTVNGK